MSKTMIKEHVINYKNQTINVLIKKNKLSRNYKLTFDKKNMRGLVSIPKYISFKSGIDFAEENIEWLSKEVKKLYPLIFIKNGSSLLIKGKKTKVIFKSGTNCTVNIFENKILIKSNRGNFKKILQHWLYDQILTDSRNYIKLISKENDLNLNKVKLSNSFNYWGSCNSKGIIHLNWRLIFAPASVLKYIIVHEVCHLKEFNHTTEFWELVKKMCPNYNDQINWLKKNDSYLYRIRFD
tara:strand:- start:215 stop:928 length:714 start_codon:yes stop_codon:yes gene_type:complete